MGICDFRPFSEADHAEILGGRKKGTPLRHSPDPQLLFGIGFMTVGCVVSESISAQNQKERDGRTDGRKNKSKTIFLRFAGDTVISLAYPYCFIASKLQHPRSRLDFLTLVGNISVIAALNTIRRQVDFLHNY